MAKQQNVATLIEGGGDSIKAATLDRREQVEGQPSPAPVSIPQTSKGLEMPVEKFPRLVVVHKGKRFGGFVQEDKALEFIRKMGLTGAIVQIEFVDANGYPLSDPGEASRRAKEEVAREKAKREYEKEQARIAVGKEELRTGGDGKSPITPRRVIQQLLDSLKDMPAKYRFLSQATEPMRHEALPGIPMGGQEKITLEIIYALDK